MSSKNSHSDPEVPQHHRHSTHDYGFVRVAGRQYITAKWGTPDAERFYQHFLALFRIHGGRLPAELNGKAWMLRKGQILAGVSWESAPEVPCPSFLVMDLVAEYLEFAKRNYRTGGKVGREYLNVRSALKHLLPLTEGIGVDDFRPRHLKAFRELLIQKGMARTTINKVVGIVCRMYHWGAEEDHVHPDTWHRLRAVRGLARGKSDARETSPIGPVAEDLFRATLPFMPPAVAAIAEVMWFTGMRPGEAVQMRRRDLDMTGEDWLYVPASHKTECHGKERKIPIGPRARKVLLEFLSLDPNRAIFQPERSRTKKVKRASANQEATGGASRRGGYTTTSFGRAVRRACERAELPLWTPNQIRHAYASGVREEFGIEAARIMLGHSNTSTTEIYAEISTHKATQIAAQIG